MFQNSEGHDHWHWRYKHNFLNHLCFFKVGEMLSKYGHSMLPGGFPNKVTPDIDIIDQAVVRCYVPVVKIILYVLVIYKWLQVNFDVNTYAGLYVLFLDPVLCRVLDS